MTNKQASTPSSLWRTNGEKDPHDNKYDCERAKLCMGNLTDDEVAFNVVVYGDKVLTPKDLDDFNKTGKVVLTGNTYREAAKDRIRWLSRSLENVIAEKEALQAELDSLKLKEVKEMESSMMKTVDCVKNTSHLKKGNN